MALSRQQVEQMITACYQAELEVLAGKTVTFGGRSVGMESLQEIRKARQEYERKLKRLVRGRSPACKFARFS
ncbi:hypothetical protein ABMX64_19885 [Vibrio vulnificus]|uniref:hypothetical protein n=1 Tax=Vibrio vulnificus TaxID=672 RepID=UPI001A336896|nr:hypothetical protein [Vibrio vulnificus]EIE1227652.1 hypothetical protein [Vibrio vulnificus]MCJ0806659.1 hypothetical protein [Vibrio vulnificus]HAS6087748.1 hypothetical protein [Vibrio vulnificus]